MTEAPVEERPKIKKKKKNRKKPKVKVYHCPKDDCLFVYHDRDSVNRCVEQHRKYHQRAGEILPDYQEDEQ